MSDFVTLTGFRTALDVLWDTEIAIASRTLWDDAGTATTASNALAALWDDAGTAHTSSKALAALCDDAGTATTASKALAALAVALRDIWTSPHRPVQIVARRAD